MQDRGVDAKRKSGSKRGGENESRHQLLEATTEAIFRYGTEGATVSRICEIAGLSRGMINLHFTSKEHLFSAVSEHLAHTYRSHWSEAINAAGECPAERLRALLAADFDTRILNRHATAVYFGFRATARTNSNHMAAIDSRDLALRNAFLDCCTRLCEIGPYPGVDPKRAAYAFLAMQEGMWTDFHLHPDRFDRHAALETGLHLAAAFFPLHFPGH